MVLAPEFQLKITRLLDMPIEEATMHGHRSYIVRVLDSNMKRLASSKPIESEAHHDTDEHTETVAVDPELGTIRVKTKDPLIHVAVEHEGNVVVGHQSIGRLHIHRLDERSAKVWPYALEDDDEQPAQCGIELQVIEPEPPKMSQEGPNQGMTVRADDVVALIDFDKVTDLPQPPGNSKFTDVVITVEAADQGWEEKELTRVGPFPSEKETSNQQLRMAMCRPPHHDPKKGECIQAVVRAPYHIGHDALEGAMYVRFAVHYCKEFGVDKELIGITDPLQVFWYESTMQYVQIKPRGGFANVGGIHCRHRLVRDGDLAKALPKAPPKEPVKDKAKKKLPQVRAGSGGFAPGSEEERQFHALTNSQAQVRAAKQRCKIHSENRAIMDTSGTVYMENGYRGWRDLDALFVTLGPHPIMLAPHVGPSVVRGFLEKHQVVHNVDKALQDWDNRHPSQFRPGGAGTKSPAVAQSDKETAQEIASWMCNQDPNVVETVMRPVVCKDPTRVLNEKVADWCPDPPMYVPVTSCNETDRETLRLAMYDEHQCAKLAFQDVTPNYRIDEDIWGVAAMARQQKPAGHRRPPAQQRRVKDDCLMA